jgi:hypothetical protein
MMMTKIRQVDSDQCRQFLSDANGNKHLYGSSEQRPKTVHMGKGKKEEGILLRRKPRRFVGFFFFFLNNNNFNTGILVILHPKMTSFWDSNL